MYDFQNSKRIYYSLIISLITLLILGSNYTLKSQDSFGRLPAIDGGEIKTLTIGASEAIFAGTWGNGIMRTNDYGVNWVNVNTGLTNMYITDVKFTSQNILFATTWGGGVFKSNDNGGTWTEQNSGLTNLKVKCIYVLTKDTLFAGTYGDGVFRSVDGGATWKASNFGLTYKEVNCMTVTRGGTIVIGTYGGGVFLSTNGGSTWKNNNGGIGSKFINTFYYRTKDSVTVAATNGRGLYISDNDAKSWVEVYDPTDSKIGDQNITCLTTVLSKGINEYVVGTRAKGIYYYASVSFDQYLQSSIQTGGINAIIKMSNGDLYCAMPRRGFLKSTDNGQIWKYVSKNYDQTSDVYTIFKPKGNLVFATGKDGGLYRSLDNGDTWSLSGFAGTKIQDLMITSANKVLVELNKPATPDAMWSSLDSGKTWFVNPGGADTVSSLLELNNGDIIAYYIRDSAATMPKPNVITVRVKKSTDGGATFADVIPMPYILGTKARFIQRPNGDLFGYTQTSPVPSLFKSINNGNAYTTLSNFTATLTPKDIKSTPNNTLYFATDMGLYKSTNDGVLWSLNNLGFVSPNTSQNPNIVGLAIKSNSEFFTGITNNDGFYKTEDTGVNWDSLNNSFTIADVQSVAMNSDNDIFMSTSSLYRMINPTSMGVPVLNVPSDLQTNVDLRPSFTWTAAKKADLYEIEISQSNNFDYANIFFTQAPTTLSLYDSLLYNTHYYWKARGKNNGSYSDWSATRAFTTMLAPPVLASPFNGARGVKTSPQLYWHPVDGSSSFTVQISNSSSFTTIAYEGTVAGDTTIKGNGLTPLTDYWWRAKASSSISTSNWSNAWKFRTTVAPPKLRYPNKGSLTEDIELTFKWDSSKEATDYRFEIAKTNDFAQATYASFTQGELSMLEKNLEYNTTYYWRVLAKNSEGTGDYSEIWDFKTSVQAPKLVSPDSNKANIPTTIFLRWSAVKSADKYNLQVSDKADFSSIPYNIPDLTELQNEISGLNRYTTYYWRVKASVGSFDSPFSNVWTFKTLMDTTRLLEPANKSKNIGLSTILKWKPTPGAVNYKLQVSRNDTYTDLFFDDSTLTDPQRDFIFKSATTYWWRVKAKSLEGTNEWSEQWSFTVLTNGVEEDLAMNTFFVYPNPFDESLSINFSLIKDSKFQIKVIDISGREIALLKDGFLFNGEQKLEWKPNGISKGTYFLQIKIGDYISLREIKYGK